MPTILTASRAVRATTCLPTARASGTRIGTVIMITCGTVIFVILRTIHGSFTTSDFIHGVTTNILTTTATPRTASIRTTLYRLAIIPTDRATVAVLRAQTTTPAKTTAVITTRANTKTKATARLKTTTKTTILHPQIGTLLPKRCQ